MNTHVLRVVWPIPDDRMFDREAVAEATFLWPQYVAAYQAEVLDTPRMHVIDLSDEQRRTLRASRAVVCSAPVTVRAEVTR